MTTTRKKASKRGGGEQETTSVRTFPSPPSSSRVPLALERAPRTPLEGAGVQSAPPTQEKIHGGKKRTQPPREKREGERERSRANLHGWCLSGALPAVDKVQKTRHLLHAALQPLFIFINIGALSSALAGSSHCAIGDKDGLGRLPWSLGWEQEDGRQHRTVPSMGTHDKGGGAEER